MAASILGAYHSRSGRLDRARELLALQPGEAWIGKMPTPVGIFEFSAVCQLRVLRRGLGMPGWKEGGSG
jgi:hypothetical protein